MNDVVKPPRVVLPHKAECVQIYPDTGKVADIPAENGAQQSQGEFLRVSTSLSWGVGIEDGSEARAFVTVGMEGGVPTGNFTQPSQAGSYP